MSLRHQAVAGHPGYLPKAPDGCVPVRRYFQAFAPVESTWPEEVITAIRADIDPEICPMWCNNVYRTPSGGLLTIGRHWLWREIRDKDAPSRYPHFVPASSGPNRGRHPNSMLAALEKNQTDEQKEQNVAGDFIPIGWWLYDVLWAARNAYEPDGDREADTREAREAETQKLNERTLHGMVSDRIDPEWADIKKNMNKLTDEELTLIGRYGLFGIPTERPKKTMVDQGART